MDIVPRQSRHVAGGAVRLIGWHVLRRFGGPGFAVFLIAWSMWGLFHDYVSVAATQSSNLMVFGPRAVPLIAEACSVGMKGVAR